MGKLGLPCNLLAAAEREGRQGWVAALPAIVRDLQERWCLTAESPFQPGGQTAWVAPVRDAVGADLVLKVGWRHPEAVDEAAGLRVWAGGGAVRIYAELELEDTTAMLLERCEPGTPLSSLAEPLQDVVVARLLQRLWIEPPPDSTFRPLQLMCHQWADEFDHKVSVRRTILDPGIARDGIDLFRSLPACADRQVLLCTDLHAGNVLAAQREPWLVIDPKPYVGDPTYDALQHMLNCPKRLRSDPSNFVDRMAELLVLDAERLRLWLFARCVQESPDWPSLADVARQIAPRS